VSIAHLTVLDGLWVTLSVFLVVLSIALVYALIRLASALRRLAVSLEGMEADALPVVRKVEATVERVNDQLDRVDRVVARPTQKVSAFAAGIASGGAALRARRDPREAYVAGREAAARQEVDIEQELAR
jgi:hypothetical protein